MRLPFVKTSGANDVGAYASRPFVRHTSTYPLVSTAGCRFLFFSRNLRGRARPQGALAKDGCRNPRQAMPILQAGPSEGGSGRKPPQVAERARGGRRGSFQAPPLEPYDVGSWARRINMGVATARDWFTVRQALGLPPKLRMNPSPSSALSSVLTMMVSTL